MLTAGASEGLARLCWRCAAAVHCRSKTWRTLANTAHLHGEIKVHKKMTVAALAKQLGASLGNVVRVMSKAGFGSSMISRDKVLPLKVQELVILEMGHTPLLPGIGSVSKEPGDPAPLKPRPPVVAVMGHVDHGKTTLLDQLRSTSVASQEAGGITQHIGAFSVALESGSRITFLDTPGHAAFTAMRARGANVTDIVVLVVAADDGVMEQTRECVKLVQQANVPVVVAINKCDKHGVNVTRVKQELLNHGVQLEEFGGDVQVVEVSALRGSGLTALEEAVLAQAEVCNLQASQQGSVKGVVIETRVDKGLGPVATVIVQHGTLQRGDILVAGSTWAKLKAMLSDQQKPLKRAPPSTPVLTVGWKDVPAAGDECQQVMSEQLARAVASHHALKARMKVEVGRQPWTHTEEGGRMSVPVLVKGDVMGSVEVVVGVLNSQKPKQLDLSVIHSGVGAISEGDVDLAASAQGLILAFNVPHSKAVGSLAKKKGVQILEHNVIYHLLEQLKEALESRLPPVWEENVMGEGVVLKVFQLKGAQGATVGGCRVKQGRLVRSAIFRLLRSGKEIHEGTIVGMKQGKDNIDSARKETECGISFSTDPGFQEGDIVQCFSRKQVPQQLLWDLGF